MSARVAQLRLAFMLLTRLPMGQLGPAPEIAQARWAFPLVGLVVGSVVWAVHAGALALGLGPLSAAFLALAAMALVTGALHLDGLADLADGFGGGRDKAHVLEIMRDSRIGSYGALALGLAVALGASALFQMGSVPLTAFLLAATASRFAMLVVLDSLPPARTDGLGHMAATQKSRSAWLPSAAAIAALLFWAPSAWVALAVVALITLAVARLALRRIGGQTGDVLGATQVLTEVGCLLALSLA